MGNEIANQKKTEPTSSELAAAAKDALGVAGSEDVVGIGVKNLQKVAKDRFSPKQGLDAMDELVRYDENCKRADEAIRKACGNDVGLYNEYLAASAHERGEERDAMRRAVEAELKNGLNVSAKEATDRRIDALVSVDSLKAAGTLANQAADGTIASEAFQSGLNVVDSQHDFGKNQIERERNRKLAEAKTDEERKKIEDAYEAQIAALNGVTSGTRTALGGMAVKQLGEISAQTETRSREYAPKLRDEFRNIFMQRYKAQLAMRQSPEIARAVAEDAVRSGSIRYFTERIKSGQISSVLYTLDEMEKIGDADFKASVTEKAPIGTYDPSAYCFLRKDDIFAIRKAAMAQIEEQRVLRNRQLIESQRGVKLKEQTLLDDITRHAIGVADDGSTPLYKSEEERVKAQKELYDRAAALKKEADALGYSTRNVFKALSNEPRKYLAMKERSERIAKKALGQQYVREQERMVEEELDRMLKAATTGGEVEIDVPVRDEQSGKEGTVKMRVDVHRAIVDAIDCARANGLCKGEYFTRVRNEHLNNKRYMEIIENAANEFFDFGTEGTVLADGKWGDRPKGSTTRIFLSEGEGGSFKADNVRSNMRVKVHMKGRKADTDESFFDTTDRYVNADTLNQIIRAGKEYLDSKLNPTAEDFRQVFGNAIREAIDKENIQSFQGDTLDTVRRHFNQVFQDHEETFGVWRNGPSTTFFGAPVGAWNQGGQTQRITVAGERRWQDVRQIIPLAQKLRNEKLKNAIIDAQYDESQGRDVDEQIRDLLDGGDTDE